MSTAFADQSGSRLQKIQQIVKWTVYSLLLINFACYISEDRNLAMYTRIEMNVSEWRTEMLSEQAAIEI